MNGNVLVISLISLIPAALIVVCTFVLDRLEREPLSLLLFLAAAGAVICIPLQRAGGVLAGSVDRMMADQIRHDLTGIITYESQTAQTLHQGLISMVCMGLVPEFGKWLVLIIFVWNNVAYDCFFDGIVYGSFLAFGSAVCENIVYGARIGWDTLALRAVVYLPAEIMAGIVMGLFFSFAREAACSSEGNALRRWMLAAALLVPAILDGALYWIRNFSGGTSDLTLIIFMTVYSIVSVVILLTASTRDHCFSDMRLF